MPAINMAGTVAANPSLGKFVIMSPFSGPKGSPFDAKSFNPTTRVLEADPNNLSTGALNTGIGHNATHIIGLTAPQSIKDAGFSDSVIPGSTKPDGNPDNFSTLVAIGGGRSTLVDGTGPDGNGTPAGTVVSATDPYTAGFPILGFGNGGARDAGAGPAFTGFSLKMVTASVATVAVGAAIEAGFLNRSDRTMVNGESAFGSSTAASSAIS